MIATSTHLGAAGAGEAGEFEHCSSARFGEIQVLVASIVDFPDGLVGIGGSRYALLCTDSDSAFVWLQSMSDPGISLPLTNPHRFFADFEVQLADEDADRLGLSHGEPADVFVTVTAREALADFTVNTRAPILIRAQCGYQVLNLAPGVSIRTPLFPTDAVEAADAG